MKKRVISILAIVGLLCCLTACAGPSDTVTPTTVATTVTTTAQVTFKTDAAGVLHENVQLTGKQATDFELPLAGATGFASYPLDVFEKSDNKQVLRRLQAGDAFTVMAEHGEYWEIRLSDGAVGFVQHVTCYLNIPDVIPSILIDCTNTKASAFVSSGEKVPEITGEKLYNAACRNERFGKDMDVIAANYNMVKKIFAAQKAALAAGYTLVINETFRPMDVQLKISVQLASLREQNALVRANIDKSPWGIGWFIANRPSTHQTGCAMDVSLAKVQTISWHTCGEYIYPTVTAYTPCEMPTVMHELSVAAVSLEKPVNSLSATAWKSIAPAASMTKDALLLQRFCTDAGMSPLASEWWHFNDLDTKERVGNRYVTDAFRLDTCLSVIPQ